MGFTPEQLDEMERQSSGSSVQPTTKKKYTAAELDAMEAKSKPKEPGFIQSLAQGIAKPFLRTGVSSPLARTSPITQPLGLLKKLGKKEYDYSTGKEQYDFGYFGKVEPLGQKETLLGNAADATGVGLEMASTFLPAGKVATLGKATLAGKVGQGIKTGVKAGGASGAMYGAGSGLQEDDATLGSVVADTAVGGLIGGATGGAIGGALPLPVGAVKAARGAANPENYTRRVIDISKPNAQKFQKLAKEPAEKYLVDRGIYGTNEEIVSQLQKRWQYSRDLADAELEKLGGTWSDPSLKAALKELSEREARTTLPGVASLDTRRIAELVAKEQSGGLTMKEVNEVKRLFESNVKTGYLRENIADKVQLSKNIDSNLRKWQLETARKLGLNNLDEINKETQLAYNLGDSIHRKISGAPDTGGLDLLDAVLIAGGDPYSIGMFAARKGLKSEKVQSGIARKLGGKAKVGLPEAKRRAPVTDTSRLLPKGNPNTTNPIYMPPAQPKPLSPKDIENNRLFQEQRQTGWQTPLGLPPGNPDLVPGAPVPLRPRNTIEPPAKTIRKYDSLQSSQRSANTVATPATNATIPKTIPKSIPQKTKKINPKDSGKIGVGPLAGIGGGSAVALGANASSKPVTTTKPTEPVKETKQGLDRDKLDREELERRFVHVENRGARDAGEDLYQVVGKTGDLGKYQVSPNSLSDWSESWLGKKYTPKEFLNDPQAQEDFFNEFLNVAEKYNLTTPEVAIAWHTGWGELGRGPRETREERFKESLDRRIRGGRYQEYLTVFEEIK